MDLFIFLIISTVYLLTIHFAIGIHPEFKMMLMVALFVLGGVVGWYFHSYDTGFVLAVILSLVLW